MINSTLYLKLKRNRIKNDKSSMVMTRGKAGVGEAEEGETGTNGDGGTYDSSGEHAIQ